MIVIDASIAVKWVVDEPGSQDAADLLALKEEFGAPDVVFAEVANVLCKKVRGGHASAAQANASLSELRDVITSVVPAADLCKAALRYAIELDHSAYDCFYLAMASAHGELVTADESFVRKCRSAGFGPLVHNAREAIDARQ